MQDIVEFNQIKFHLKSGLVVEICLLPEQAFDLADSTVVLDGFVWLPLFTKKQIKVRSTEVAAVECLQSPHLVFNAPEGMEIVNVISKELNHVEATNNGSGSDSDKRNDALSAGSTK